MTKKLPLDPNFDRFDELMTGELDGELSPAEQAEFERLLAASPERQKKWSEYKKLKELTMQMRFNDPPEEVWDGYWVGIYRRLERGLAWILVSVGLMVLLSYGGYKTVEEIFKDSQLPWLVKGGSLVLLVGGVVLFVSVLREKLFTRKTDKYKEIQR
jgi:hypothetical protein